MGVDNTIQRTAPSTLPLQQKSSKECLNNRKLLLFTFDVRQNKRQVEKYKRQQFR